MANSIRTPRQGVTANSRRIAEAVDDEEWQEFRLSLKGKSTGVKLSMLQAYFTANAPLQMAAGTMPPDMNDDVCIRVDNYIKALCRGGQLQAGIGLHQLINDTIGMYIKR